MTLVQNHLTYFKGIGQKVDATVCSPVCPRGTLPPELTITQ